MAFKTTFKGRPAYEEEDLILQLLEDGWHVFHKPTSLPFMGYKEEHLALKIHPFKQKKQALAYAKHFIDSKFDFDFKDTVEMLKVNGGYEAVFKLREEAYRKSK